ncbi:MAG TPA: YdeI/OmpD-associated family protein [Thermomicrobiales bacterium]|nr:YdeI/OmpD-associated family protein [Thermomicrobiales bacterium]
MAEPKDIPILSFASAEEFEQWLAEHQAATDGLWIKIAKKASGIASVTYDEALDVALCYGWIDGQKKTHDDAFFLQKFTPRRPRSLWSKRNIGKVAVLMEAGRMQPAGLAEVEAAKQDGRWEAAYDSPKDMVVPDDFLEAVRGNPQTQAYFESLNKSSVYAIGWRLATAKTPATRQRRFDKLLAMLEAGEFR